MKLRRIVEHGSGARNKLAKGAKYLAEAVGSTVGPFGQNFFLDKGNKITNDGAKVAAEIVLKDEIENRGAIAAREVASKTNDQAGDGTTTSLILFGAIYEAASRKLADEEKGRIAGVSPSEVVRQIENERLEITKRLVEMAEEITTEAQLINSAIVSVEDSSLGELIGKAQWKLGKTGVLLAEESAERESSVEFVKGVRIDNGLGTSLIMNNQEKQCLEVEDTRIILTNHTLQDLKPLQKVIEQLVKSGFRTITIVARAFSSEAIQICLKNIHETGVKIYPLNAPYVDQAEIMKDMQAVLGGTYYHDEASSLEDMQLSDIGFAKRVVARRYDAVFTGQDTDESKKRVEARVMELESKLSGTQSDFERRTLGERIAQLKNGFGIVKVGSPSEMERKRLFDKCEDAVQAVRAAYQEGVVPGAGVAFKQISETLPESYLLKRPLLSLYEQIKSSAPRDWEVEAWVKDPVKVLRIALQNACLIAASLATAGGVVTAENAKLLDELLRKTDETDE